jgi:Xaa-Pro dipeptidase
MKRDIEGEMFTALEQLPRQEMELRHENCRRLIRALQPESGGLLVFSRVNTYYLTGHCANGVLWLPMSGEPVLMIRKGIERAEMESPLARIVPFRSYSDLPGLCAEAGAPLLGAVAVEMGGLSWSLGQLLQAKLKGVEFRSGDDILTRARGVKTEWELAKMRLCGERHDRCLREELPKVIRPGMNEFEISVKAWEVFFAAGHHGMMRMNTFGEEIFLGHVSAGDSGNYPSVFNGPLGVRGVHPAIPQMGYAGKVWMPGEVLALDIGFLLEGYHTDKTQVYFAGRESDLPDEARRAHDFCIRVQNWLAENLRPGAIPSTLYAHVMDWAERENFAHGFMGLGGNKVRFLGHGIGLGIDEYPVIAKGFDDPLEEGMVLAIEPKYGIEGLGMVGVENTFEVTAEGGRCLTGKQYEILFQA